MTTLTTHARTVKAGPGAIQLLPELIASRRRAFVVADPGVTAAGVTATVVDILTSSSIEVAVFDDIHPNPATEHLDAGAKAIRAFGECIVLAVGGGAVMDVAKGLALMAVNAGSARDFDYHRTPERSGLPVVAVPTTAGTGSETNAWGVIDDPIAGRKFYVGHESVAPGLVVLDAELTIGVPPGPTAAAGMDALVHALESLSSVRRNPYADALNLEVVRSISLYLPRAVADGRDLEARHQLLWAAHLAGLAFGTTGLGMGHAVAHALSARIGAPHGVALATLLPHVLEFHLPVCRDIYATVAAALNPNGTTAKPELPHDATAAIESVRRLAQTVGMPSSLGELGLTQQLIPLIVTDALADEVMLNTPRLPTSEELHELLAQAM